MLKIILLLPDGTNALTKPALTKCVRCMMNKGSRILKAAKSLRRLYKLKALKIVCNSLSLVK